MHRVALHRLEPTRSLSEGTICVKACQFLGWKCESTEPTPGAPRAICVRVLSVPDAKPGGARQQRDPTARAGAELRSVLLRVSLPADATERT